MNAFLNSSQNRCAKILKLILCDLVKVIPKARESRRITALRDLRRRYKQGMGLLVLFLFVVNFNYIIAQSPNKKHHDHAHEEDAEEEGHEEAVVDIPQSVLNEFNIESKEIGPETIHRTVTLPGEIKYNREQIAVATPRYSGIIRKIHVLLGDKVEKGEVLASLENNETLRPFTVTAPFAGTVVDFNLTLGQSVDAGSPLFKIADLSSVWADLQIYQKNLAEVQEGQSVEITSQHYLPDYLGTIDYVSPVVDEHTRTGLARVVVKNSSRIWRPGLFVKGRIVVSEKTVPVAIPHSAVLAMNGNHIVFVKTPEGFEPRAVTLGVRDEEFIAVTDGLKAGETIVIRNAISLKAEMGKGSFGGHQH